MRKNDIIRDIALALVLLTRLPLPKLPEPWFQRQAQAAWAFPLAGLAITLPACATAALALWLGLPAPAAAGLLLVIQIVLTGAMHEDGLADTADGFWGGFTLERRLEIMKDSQIGTYGVLALIMTVGLRWLALSALLPMAGVWPILALSLLSRATMPVLMVTLSNARKTGLSQSVGRPEAFPCVIGISLATFLSVLMIGSITIAIFAMLSATTVGLAFLAYRKIGGQTGDVLGTSQQLAELSGLLLLLVL
ncbi:adenosylcobinamide-GDP ribazoletransferase [Parasedimentitalea maritima]|uniref:Adenosylcobinamide-GDP ribazoletransferase n=1 Tax=Parasedimentitalea maritima TaxID=2578117 RepID=A0A6A4RDG0_9RHOB|nr:adenosylcobinamide-GDP ribazoletransferase [Zongyanglinia marina]KAE9627848.1 adenosylcobinamide-GDP ribazoletransferase [Zongyanglinia marina]